MHDHVDDPSSFPDPVQIIDDSDAPNASNFNVSPTGLLNRTKWLKSRTANPGQNWYSQFAGGSNQFQCACPIVPTGVLSVVAIANQAQWMYVTQSSSKLQAVLAGGLDGASGGVHLGTFFGPDGNTCYEVACVQDSSGTPWVVALGTVSATLTLYVLGWNGSAWQIVETVTSFTGSPLGLAMCSLAGRVIYALGNVIAGDTYVESSPDGWNTNSNTVLSAGMAFDRVLLKSNGAIALLMPAETPMGASPSYYSSTDGITWTQRFFAGITFGTTDRIEGLCWYELANSGGGEWVLAVQTAWGTSPATTAFYSSTDGINWTLLAVGPENVYLADLEAVGNALVCTLQDGNAAAGGSGSASDSQIFSDDGGVTWYFSQASLLTNAASSTRGYTRPRLVAGPGQLFAFNTAFARWSHICGLPEAL